MYNYKYYLFKKVRIHGNPKNFEHNSMVIVEERERSGAIGFYSWWEKSTHFIKFRVEIYAYRYHVNLIITQKISNRELTAKVQKYDTFNHKIIFEHVLHKGKNTFFYKDYMPYNYGTVTEN